MHILLRFWAVTVMASSVYTSLLFSSFFSWAQQSIEINRKNDMKTASILRVDFTCRFTDFSELRKFFLDAI